MNGIFHLPLASILGPPVGSPVLALMVGKAHTLPNFAALSQHIDPQWIAQALAATGKASVRRRKLPAEQVL